MRNNSFFLPRNKEESENNIAGQKNKLLKIIDDRIKQNKEQLKQTAIIQQKKEEIFKTAKDLKLDIKNLDLAINKVYNRINICTLKICHIIFSYAVLPHYKINLRKLIRKYNDKYFSFVVKDDIIFSVSIIGFHGKERLCDG